MSALKVALCAAILLFAVVSLVCGQETVDKAVQEPLFCIVGAGPGGVQVAHFMQQLGMRYVLFERGATVGNFFTYYPRQRKLISINKVHTGRTDPEFNLRHDWNSLLTERPPSTGERPSNSSTAEPLLFKSFSLTYFPHAGRLVDYLAAFVEHHGMTAHIKLRHNVDAIARLDDGGFSLRWTALDAANHSTHGSTQCSVVVVASGKDVPVVPTSEGVELTNGCYEIPTDPKLYTNKDILVIGTGNSALEFIQSVEDYTASVHLMSRYPMKMSYQSHYVGHSRALNLGILDKYQLKSQDVLLAGMDVSRLRFRRDPATQRIRLEAAEPQHPGQGGPQAPRAFQFVYDQVIHCLGFTWDKRPFLKGAEITNAAVTQSQCNTDNAGGCQSSDSGAKVPAEDKYGRYAAVASNFESVNIPDLFVAGTLMHYRDFKKSSGGFIHGFRYLIRTMVYQLRERYLGVPYPEVQIGPCYKVAECSDLLVEHFSRRLARVSSLYQLQGVLSDVVFYVPRDDKLLQFGILEDVPLDMVKSVQPDRTNMKRLSGLKSFLTVSLEFAKYYQGSGILYHQAQPETPSRTREKMMWAMDADPDALIGSGKSGSVNMTKGRASDAERQTLELLEGFLPVRTASSSITRVNDGEPLEEPAKETLMGLQFLHPIFRQWFRMPGEVKNGRQLTKCELLSEIQLREDVNNDWTDPEMHLNPLRKYLTDLIPAMRLTGRTKL